MNKLTELVLILGLIAFMGFLGVLFANYDEFVGMLADKAVEAYQPVFDEIKRLEEERQQEINQCIEDDYIVYLDGEEVDVKKIDLSIYTTSINHEEKVIYATKQESDDGDSVIPILWPLFFR